jgi:hypothetical protein
MKTTNKLMVLIALTIITMLFSRCTLSEDLAKIQNSLDSVKIYVGTPKFITTVNLRFVDAKTHEPISDQVVSVNISGKDAAKVFNNIGRKADTYSAHDGRLDLVIDPHGVDTSALKNNPIQFVVIPTLSGYLASPQIVTITNAKRSYVEVQMMNISNPPDGITIFQNINVGTTDANGVLTQSQTVSFVKGKSGRLKSAGSDTIFVGSPIIEIPVGAVFKDIQGNPLSGDVSMEGVFGNYSRLLPNLSDLNKALNSQYTYLIKFYVNGTYGNSMVNSIVNRDIKIKFFLSDTTINKFTKLPWKENDIIPFWQYIHYGYYVHNSKTDTIKSENKHLFIEQSGKYLYSYNINLVDSFTSGYGFWGFQIPTCPSIRFNYNFVNNPAYGVTWIEHTMLDHYENYSNNSYFNNQYPSSDSIAGSGPFPLGYTTKHSFGLSFGGDKDFTYKFSPQEIVTDDGSCANTYDITITETAKQGVQFVTANLDINLVQNGQTVFKPNGFYYMSEGSWDGNYNAFEFYLDGGKALINLKLDRLYGIGNWLGNEFVVQNFIIKDNGTYYEVSVTDLNSNVKSTYKVQKSKVSGNVDFKLNIPIPDHFF